MYFITTKRMLEVCFSAHPNIQYRTLLLKALTSVQGTHSGSRKNYAGKRLYLNNSLLIY